MDRDREMAGLLAAYAKAGDAKAHDAKHDDAKASPAKGFPPHVPLVAQRLTALLASFDSYERRTGLVQPRHAHDPRVAVYRGFLKAQHTWLKTLRADTEALREVRQMLQARLAMTELSLEQAIERAQMREAFRVSSTPAASSVTTRREGKGDEPDGDSVDEA